MRQLHFSLDGIFFAAIVRRMRFKEWFEASGLTQVQVAAKIGRHQAAVSRALKGQTMLDPDAMARLRALTDGAVTADDLLDAYIEYTRRAKRREARAA